MLVTVVSWSVVAVLLSLFAAPGNWTVALPPSLRVLTVTLFAGCIAIGTSTARVSSAVRAGHVCADAAAPAWHPILRAWGQGVVAAALVALAANAAPPASWRWLLVAGAVGVFVGALVRVPASAAPRHQQPWPWVLAGAIPSALVAAGLGAVVAATRFGLDGEHAAGAVSRALAGTFVFDALLALGGFARAFGEVRSGLVVSSITVLPSAPSPFAVALGVAAVVVLVGPAVLPPLSGGEVIAVKTLGGALVGGGLSLIGAVRGARAAAGFSA